MSEHEVVPYVKTIQCKADKDTKNEGEEVRKKGNKEGGPGGSSELSAKTNDSSCRGSQEELSCTTHLQKMSIE